MYTDPAYEKFKPSEIMKSLAVDPYINMKGSAWRRKIEMVAAFKDSSGKEFLFPVNLSEDSIEIRPLYLDDIGIVRLGFDSTNPIPYMVGTNFENAVYYYNVNRYSGQGRVVPNSLVKVG